MIRQLERRHRVQLEEAENRWKSKLSQKFECQSMEKSRQETELERKEEQWAEARRTLEDQIHQLKAELKEREEEMIVKHKGYKLFMLFKLLFHPTLLTFDQCFRRFCISKQYP